MHGYSYTYLTALRQLSEPMHMHAGDQLIFKLVTHSPLILTSVVAS